MAYTFGRDEIIYQNTIAEKELLIRKLREDNDMMSSYIHRNNKRLPSFINSIVAYITSDREDSKSKESILNYIELIRQELVDITKYSLHGNDNEHITDSPIINGLISIMMTRATKTGIEFNVEQGSKYSQQQQIITSSDLQTLLADLIENAINAVGISKTKRISLFFGTDEKGYKICIADSGRPFEVETLISLGKKKTTTRKMEGGSGIGYMTIFEILRQYRASLLITELEAAQSGFTKSIKVLFDGKSEYVIKTYRAEKINKDYTRAAGAAFLLQHTP